MEKRVVSALCTPDRRHDHRKEHHEQNNENGTEIIFKVRFFRIFSDTAKKNFHAEENQDDWPAIEDQPVINCWQRHTDKEQNTI